jgi:hydroxymethylpyrimidine/phosphomethylpyrimidine kinase
MDSAADRQTAARAAAGDSSRLKVALTIAGSDGSAGAGIQADLKTFYALGVYGLCAITAVTVQDTHKVHAVEEISPQIVHDQIVCLFEDIAIDAVKIGMVSSVRVIDAVAEALRKVRRPPLVLDPVMVSKSGYDLLRADARRALVEQLFPLAEVVTPNIPEAEALTGDTITSPEHMQNAARRIVELGAANAVVKGGHLTGDQAVDILYDGQRFHHLGVPRLDKRPAHGTGCTFSAAIAAGLARGETLFDAVHSAKRYITGAIAHCLDIGKGHRPTHHFFDLYAKAGLSR